LKLLFDLRHNLGERISLRQRQVGLFVLAEDLEQLNRPFGAVIVIDHSHTTAFASAGPGKSDLADASRARENIAPQGMSCQEIDKLIPLVLRQKFSGTRNEVACLDDCLHL
jgi:hypothetical protein